MVDKELQYKYNAFRFAKPEDKQRAMLAYEQAVWDSLFNAHINGKESPLDSLVPALLKYRKYLDEHAIESEFMLRILGFDIIKRG